MSPTRAPDEVHRVDCAGATAFVVLDAVLRGRSFGGVRIRDYPTEQAALDDATGLARAMSRKVVMAGIAGGGGKAVLMTPKRRPEAVRALGEFIESLGGRYFCGADLGFTGEDEAVLRSATRHIACGNLSAHSARSVLLAMEAVCTPRTVAIQGMGAVGRALADLLGPQRVIASDLRPVAGFRAVPADSIYDVEADVFAPCAAGGVLNAETIGRLRCRVVCGGANNPLAYDADAERLQARDVIYIPDFIANAGATIMGASTAIGEGDQVGKRMAAIPGIVREILARGGRSTHAAAVAMADERIARLR